MMAPFLLADVRLNKIRRSRLLQQLELPRYRQSNVEPMRYNGYLLPYQAWYLVRSQFSARSIRPKLARLQLEFNIYKTSFYDIETSRFSLSKPKLLQIIPQIPRIERDISSACHGSGALLNTTLTDGTKLIAG
jgi:hypothetical protein